MIENDVKRPPEGFIHRTARKSQFLNKLAFIVILVFGIVALVDRFPV